MKSNDLLRQITKADSVLVEVGTQSNTKWEFKVDKVDLEMQIMHVTNGMNVETGLSIYKSARWSRQHGNNVIHLKATSA